MNVMPGRRRPLGEQATVALRLLEPGRGWWCSNIPCRPEALSQPNLACAIRRTFVGNACRRCTSTLCIVRLWRRSVESVINLPVLHQLDIERYGLFPGTESEPGLHAEFAPGLKL